MPAAGPSDIDATDRVLRWWRGYIDGHPVASLRTVGGQCVLAVRTFGYLFADVVRGRFPFWEFVEQAVFMARTAVVPTLFVAIPISVTLAILMAAAVGSAMGADLGSRAIRDETDAMEVMGVSVIRRLVVPRLAASVIISVALTGFTCFIGFLAGYAFTVMLQGGTPGSYTSTFSSFATVDDLVLTLIKAVVFGVIVAIIACYKGLHTRGGPAGVANSVNAAVVQSILLLLLANVLISQMYLVLFPKTSF